MPESETWIDGRWKLTTREQKLLNVWSAYRQELQKEVMEEIVKSIKGY